jgi:hypothetical protein
MHLIMKKVLSPCQGKSMQGHSNPSVVLFLPQNNQVTREHHDSTKSH